MEGAIASGMRRFPRGFADLRTVPGWALHRLPNDRIELRSPDGGVYSASPSPPRPTGTQPPCTTGTWCASTARSSEYAPPPDSTPEQYNDAKRLEEFRTARGRGLVADGITTYRNNR
ncbi:hypothetical protein ACFYY1_41645 [Streptomyces sp. NPDC001890]|uniref:hypothetical protein n=1 Tax=Streptomyces sp. NPDC001890 TaxID=3364620 RepID=UPI0036B6987B